MTDFKVTLFPSAESRGERILVLEGDSFEQGRQHGRAVPDLFARNLEEVRKQIASHKGTGLDALYRQAASFVEKNQPEIWQEYRGMAEGSGMPFEDILTLNLKIAHILGFLDFECSQYARVVRNADGTTRTLIAKTRDLKPGPTEHVVLIRRYPDGYEALEIHKAGMIGYPGSIMTNRGFALGTSGIWCKRTPFDRSRIGSYDVGTNGHITARAVHGLDDLAAAMNAHRRLTGINNVVAVSGEVAALEVTADSANLLDRGKDMVIRTNHYLTPAFKSLSPTPEENASSFHRFKRITEMLPQASTPEDFWHIAQDHQGYPQNSVCRHKTDEPRPSFTSYASVFDLENRHAYVGFGNPCEMPFQAS